MKNELALFAGAGGGILGGYLLGWHTTAAVEIEPYAREVLLARQRDGILPKFPIWDDIRTFDGRLFAGKIDIITGGFPCQDISSAGKGAGIDGERSGLWSEMFRIVCEIRPREFFVENSPMLTIRGLGRVLGDLSSIGYDAEWIVLGADDLGAPHIRKRIWILARTNDGDSHSDGEPICSVDAKTPRLPEFVADAFGAGSARTVQPCQSWSEVAATSRGLRWPPEPDVDRMANGMAFGMERLAALGNGQVPVVAAAAYCILSDRFGR